MKKKFLLLNFLLLCLGLISAQQQDEKIVFPNPPSINNSDGRFARPTSDDGYILTGIASGPQTNGSLRLIKLNSDHEVEWDKVAYFLDPPSASNPYVNLSSAAIQNAAGGYAAAFQNDSSGTDFLLFNTEGDIIAKKDLFPWANNCALLGTLPGGGYLVGREYSGFDLLHLDAGGNVTAQYPQGNIAPRSILLGNGDVLMCYKQSNKIIFRRTDVTGNLIWQTLPNNNLIWWGNQEPVLAATSDGGFAMLSYESQSNKNRVYRFDAQGNQTWISPVDAVPASMVPTGLAIAANGQYLLSGRTVTNRGFVAQLNADGSAVEWSAESPEDGQEHLKSLNAIPTPDGWAVGVGPTNGNKFGFMSVSSNTGVFVNYISGFVRKDNDDNCIADAGEPVLQATSISTTNGVETFYGFSNSNGFYNIAVPSGDWTLTVSPNQPFFYLCPTVDVSVSLPPSESNSVILDLPMQSQQPIHQVTGTVRLDQNNNCTGESNEPLMENWLVELSVGAFKLHADTDADGEYSFFVPDGNYTVKLIPYNQNFGVCSPVSQTLNLTGPDPQVAAVDFTAKANFSCALMRAELTRWNMRPCSTTIVRAHYRNIGTVTAEDASIQVTLDPMLTYDYASVTPVSIDGQVLTFELGDVPPTPGSEWGFIDIHATVDCAAQIGDQLCITAKVTPDTVCYQSQEWSGAIVAVSGVCENDNQAIFTISNVGFAPNAQTLDYTIIEDQIVLKTGTFQLNAGQSQNDTVPGSGLPLTIIAQQEPGYPGDTSVVFNLYNCGEPDTTPANGFGGPSGPFTYQECFPVTNSYDPNDKDAAPQGFGPDHVVHPGTPLEYRIRFQNTGNDTAFLVVLRDTLSQALDFLRIEPRGSSHIYDFAQINDSILQFTFNNIQLPDSSTNPLGSQGFVEFTAYPNSNLPLGTQVTNRAAIYFDHNPPVITNTVLRTYGEVILVSIDDPAGAELWPVKVYPNPFVTETTFELPANAGAGTHQLNLMDAGGRLLSSVDFEGQQCRLQRNNLPAGVFAWTITSAGRPVASGKLIVL